MAHFHQQTIKKVLGANKMAGMIESIFGKTTAQLAEERKIRDRQLTEQFAKLAEQRNANPAGAAIGASFGTSFARGLLGGIGLDPEMEKARQAEEQQAALNEQLSGLDRNDPRRFYLLSDAYSKAGDIKTATDYLRLGQQIESAQERFKQDKAEKDAARAAESEKRKTLSEAYPNNPQAQKMALAGFTVDQIEKIIGAKKQKAFIAEATKDDIEQVSSFFAMNDLDFGEETQPVVVRMLAEDLSRLKNNYSKEFEEGSLEKPWMGDTQAISSLLGEYQAKGYITNEPSTFGVGGGLRFNPRGQQKQNKQTEQPAQQTQTAVEATFPEGLPTNNNNNTSKQTEASMGTLGDIIGVPTIADLTSPLPTKEQIQGLYNNFTGSINWQDYLNK